MEVVRSNSNPIITPKDVKPSRPDFEVFGVFNAGVTRVGERIVLLLRVAERPLTDDADKIAAAIYEPHADDITIKTFSRSDPRIDCSDPRLIVTPKLTYLTSISQLRLAFSTDGLNFEVDDKPVLAASSEYESFGVEDPRISPIDEKYYVSYVAVSPSGVTTCLASTSDFRKFTRHGIIFCPENKDVVIFPGKINGRFYALHRPVSPLFKTHDIWIAESFDLLHWGNHRRLFSPRAGFWDELKVGAGAVPVRLEAGWLEIYHGVDRAGRYSLGAVLLDAENPGRIIARSNQPILQPQAEYECSGVFGNVVFTCGLLCEDEKLRIYYGAADTSVAYAETAVADVLSVLNF